VLVSAPPPPPTTPPLTPFAVVAVREAHRQAFAKLVADRLYRVRWALHKQHGDAYSQRRVASVLGRSPTWLCNLENGHRRVDVIELRTLAAVYQIDPGQITGEPEPGQERAQYDAWVAKWRSAVTE